MLTAQSNHVYWGSDSLKVIESDTTLLTHRAYDFLFVFHSKYASIYYRCPFPRYSRVFVENRYPLYSATPLGVKPSHLRNKPWWQKN